MTSENPSALASQALDALYRLAIGACQLIKTFQPELIVSLAHSDIGPLQAIQTYWKETELEPFPPLVRINLGVEKQRVYEAWRLANGMSGFDVQDASAVDFHHFQAWFYQHKRYQVEFQTLIADILPSGFKPQRVLILDEVSQGTTRRIAFALLSGIYPEAELRFCAGVQDWTNALGEEWLRIHYPTIWQELQKEKTEQSLNQRFPTRLHADLKQIVVGTEDCDKDSLTWRPIHESDGAVQALVQHGIQLDDCLACSGWVQTEIADYISKRLTGVVYPIAENNDDQPRFGQWTFEARDRVWIEIWNRNGISLSEWAAICGQSRSQAKKAIWKEWQFWENIQPAGFGAHTIYRVDPIFLPELPEEVAQTRAMFLKLSDGRLLAQGYPGWYPSHETLIEEQINFIIDLTTVPAAPEDQHYFPNRNPDWIHYCYHADFQERAAEAGLDVTIKNFPIQPYAVPTIVQMIEILNTIDDALTANKRLFLHDKRGNERVGVVLGCFLVRHGMSGKDAIQQLNQQLAKTFISGYRIPGTEGQHRFVLRWKTGQ